MMFSWFTLPNASTTMTDIGTYSSAISTELFALIGILVGFFVGGLVLRAIVRAIKGGVKTGIGGGGERFRRRR